MTTICVPELGEDIDKATVVEWHVQVGDAIEADDDIVELVTDKATFNVSAPASGTLKEIKVPAGEEVVIGAVIGVID